RKDDLQRSLPPSRPLAAHLVAVALAGDRVERNPAQRKAHAPALMQHEPEQLRDGLGRIAVDRNRSDVKLAYARIEPAEEVLISERLIEVNQNRWQCDRMLEPRQAQMQVVEQLGEVKPPHFGRARERVAEAPRPLAETLDLVAPARRSA